ncbi:MAG: metallophosphoesterase [Clostridia bacterium]|nr:metallophosphoesterase [Clostridia bacterium]
MYKKMIGLILAISMLIVSLPILALPLAAQETAELDSTSFMADRVVSTTADPMTYYAWAEANSGLDKTAETYEDDLAAYMNTEAAKAAFREYYFTMGKVVWSGDWMTGGIHNTTGAFEPIAYHTQFVAPTWQKWSGAQWYSTRSAAETFMTQYLAGSTNIKLWDKANIPLHSYVTSTNAGRSSLSYKAYFSYTYTVPAEKSGLVQLAILPDNYTVVNSTACFCVMLNDEIVWPSDADISKPQTTWGTGYTSKYQLVAAVAEIALTVKSGDQIHFVATDKSANTVKLNPRITYTDSGAWVPTTSTAGKDLLMSPSSSTGLSLLTYEQFCAQELTTTDETSKAAYKDYVLNFTSAITWTGNWSAGNSVLSGNAYVYEPIAYRLAHASASWSALKSVGSRYTTASAMISILDKHLISDAGTTDDLWKQNGVIYGMKSNVNGVSSLLNSKNGSNAGVCTWAYTVPNGVTELSPSASSATVYAGASKANNTRVCIMKNGVPVWPTGATTDAATWATKTTQGWAAVYPTADELNNAWANVKISVQPGDVISVCYKEGGADVQHKCAFSMTDTKTSTTETYAYNGFTSKENPVTYAAFCAANSTARAAATAYAKHAYAQYLLEKTKVTYQGDWSLGQMTTGAAFRLLAYLNVLQGKTHTGGYTQTSNPYVATEEGMKDLLSAYLAGNTADMAGFASDAWLLGKAGYVAHASGANTLAYRYTMPQAGRVRLSLADGLCSDPNATMAVCVMLDGKVIWPSDALIDKTDTWAVLTSNTLDRLNKTLSSVKPYAEEGKHLDFLVNLQGAAAGSTYSLNPCVEIFSPIAELFELQGSATLGRAFGAVFIATYPDKTVADAADVTLSPSSAIAAHITQTITDVENDNGTLTRYYYLSGFAASELTEPISYTIQASAYGESKTASGSVAVADLISYHLKIEGGEVDIGDETSTLALATLNYAAAAQNYFSHNISKPANATVPEGQREPGVKISDREIADLSTRKTEGAVLHYTQASLLLNEVVTLKLALDANAPIADLTSLSLVVKTADGSIYEANTLIAYRDDDKNHTRIKAYADIPMLYYSSELTFGVYCDGVLISDELTYGVGCYAKRTYGTSDKQDAVLDSMLMLGDAATDYRNNVENVLTNGGAAIPANPGDTIDLSCYSVLIGGVVRTGSEVTWIVDCDELQIAQDRYVLAPTTAGSYRLLVVYDEYVIATAVAVCDENGEYTVDTVDKNTAAIIDLSAYGAAAELAGATVPDYWTWALNVAAYTVDQNEKKAGGGMSSFFFVTDTHWENNNKKTFDIANYLYEEAGIQHLVFGGDYINGSTTIEAAEPKVAAFLAAMETFRGDWYAVRGNHDNNGAWEPETAGDVWTDAEYYEKFHQYSANAREDGELYNYVDDADAKIRYYFFDDGSTNPYGATDVNTAAYATQMAWLKETAATLEEGWGIVVVQHRPRDFANQLLPVLNEIDKTNDVIAVFGGHHHRDLSTLTDGGYYIITTTSDAGGSTSAGDPITPNRTPGTSIEQLMEIVQIDRVNRKVYLIRVGAGASRVFDY